MVRHHESACFDVTDVDTVRFLVSHISDRKLPSTILQCAYVVVGMSPAHADAALFLQIMDLAERLLFECIAFARSNDHVSCP